MLACQAPKPSYGLFNLAGVSANQAALWVQFPGAAAVDKASHYLRTREPCGLVEDALVWAARPLVDPPVSPAAGRRACVNSNPRLSTFFSLSVKPLHSVGSYVRF